MAELHFKDILNKEHIDTIRKDPGFGYALPLEKFIMDFEMLTHIQKVIPDCVVKGGMAVPFHLHDRTLRRLSVDIDIVTGSSREEIVKAMKIVSEKLKSKVEIGKPHIPKGNSNKTLPLLTYFCDYQSSVDENPQIKIEIFYGNNMQIQSKKIKNKTEIMGLGINFPLSIYDRESLIGDKLTALPFNTIGIDHRRELDVPKQIYDIATLLKSVTGELSMEMIIDTFEKISLDETTYFKENPPTFKEMSDDLDTFSDKILITNNQIKLNPSYQGRFQKFAKEMLGNRRYPSYDHVADILLIKVMVKLILKKFNGIESEKIAKKTKQMLNKLRNLSALEDIEKRNECKKLVSKYGKNSDEGKQMKNLLAEQAYLYDQLIQIDKM